MKIYKNQVCVTMGLDEFHDILESDMFEDLLLMIMELDGDNTMETEYENEFELSSSHQIYQVEDMDSFMDILQEALQEEGIHPYWSDSMEGFDTEEETIFDTYIQPAPVKENNKSKKLNKLDEKVNRILNKYKDVAG